MREEGPAALYKGFAPKVLRLAPGGGVLLLVVEFTLGIFRKGTLDCLYRHSESLICAYSFGSTVHIKCRSLYLDIVSNKHTLAPFRY